MHNIKCTVTVNHGNVLSDPRGAADFNEYPADLFMLGELGLLVGQSLLYVFDFGDYWAFNIEITGCSPHGAKPAASYTLVQSVGDAPEQYSRRC